MKKINFLAVALAALTMFSCSKEEIENPDAVSRVLTVKIANPASSSRAVEAPGSSAEGTITLENGVIFTLNGDAVANAYALNATDVQTATGQVIPDKVTSATTVFIVANIPAETVTDWTTEATRPATLTAIKAAQFEISDENGKTYTKATLSNTSAQAVTPTVTDGNAKAAVELSPVYSRLELPQVVGEGNIESFSVTGVYVDDFYTQYTAGGSFKGTVNSMGVTPPTAAWPAEGMNEGSWASVANVATPGGSNVWAYNLPSGNLPRLVIKLENVVVSGVALTGTWYLTVKSYTGVDNNIFSRGDIYNITGGLKFDQTHIGPTPNPTENDLWVSVTLKQWTIKSVGVIL